MLYIFSCSIDQDQCVCGAVCEKTKIDLSMLLRKRITFENEVMAIPMHSVSPFVFN